MPPKSSPICLLYLYTFLLDKLLLSLVLISYLSIPLLLTLYNAHILPEECPQSHVLPSIPF